MKKTLIAVVLAAFLLSTPFLMPTRASDEKNPLAPPVSAFSPLLVQTISGSVSVSGGRRRARRRMVRRARVMHIRPVRRRRMVRRMVRRRAVHRATLHVRAPGLHIRGRARHD